MKEIINFFNSIGLFGLFLITPVILNIGLIRLSYTKDEVIDKKEYLYCFIPLFNNFFAWKKYSGSYLAVHGLSYVVLTVSVLVRYIVMYTMYSNNELQYISVFLFLFSVLLFWISNAICIFNILRESGVIGIGACLFYSATIIIGQIMIGLYLKKSMDHYYSKKESLEYGRYSK